MQNERWAHGTFTPSEIEQMCEQEQTPLIWKLLNTITNMQGLLEGSDALAKQQARQLEGYRELHELDLRAAEGEKTSFEDALRAADKAGLMTDSMRAEWLTPA